MAGNRNATTQHIGTARTVGVTLLLMLSLVLIMLVGPLASYAEFLATGVARAASLTQGLSPVRRFFGTVAVSVVCVLRAMWWVEAADAAGSQQVGG